MKYQNIFFDLDGTLLETLEDIKNAFNLTMEEMGIEVRYSYNDTKPFIGNGFLVAIERATKNLNLNDEQKEIFTKLGFKYYEQEQGKTTKPYPNEIEVLNELKAQGVNLFVVTNKPEYLAFDIVKRKYGKGFFKEIIGQKEGRKTKPEPDGIYELLKKYAIDKSTCLYVGDSEVDILTAKNAGIDCLLVTFGYGKYSPRLFNDATYIARNTLEMRDVILGKITSKFSYSLEDHEWPFKGVTHSREVARAILLDENNKVCLEYILDDDMFGHRDYYETPGGGMKEDETFEQSLSRECSEEIGYECEIIAHLGDVFDYYNLINRENHNHYFLARRTKKTYIHQEPDEVQRVKGIIWVDIDEAIRLYENMQDELVGKLVKQRELPILRLAKIALQNNSK